jgi:hypothetical protein
MKHVRASLEELRRYISTCEARPELEEVDVLLSMALEEVRRKLASKAVKSSAEDGDRG